MPSAKVGRMTPAKAGVIRNLAAGDIAEGAAPRITSAG